MIKRPLFFHFALYSMAFLFISSADAVLFRVENPCDLDRPILVQEVILDQSTSVGELTVSLLQKNKIPFTGSSEGFNSINNSPVGLDAFEFTPDDEWMLAFGMCYSVDGIIVEKMPHELMLDTVQNITWFLGYSTMSVKKGTWELQCEDATKINFDSEVIRKYCKK